MIKYVNTTINGLTLRGTAHVPEGVIGPVPTVLLFHGFGAVYGMNISVRLSKLVANSQSVGLLRLRLISRVMVKVMVISSTLRLAMKSMKARN